MTDLDPDRRHNLDWSNVDVEKAREVFALGQKHLEAQLETALAADARATALAGLCITLAAAILAAGLAHWDAEHSRSILSASIVATAFLLASAGRAAWAARPIPFSLPGTHPEAWFQSLNDDLQTLYGGQAELDDRDIRRNEQRLQSNGRAVMQAFWGALAAPVAAFLTWGLLACSF